MNLAVINTTDIVESSMFLKAKLKKNMVGDNYYLETLQSKIDAEWDYRYNVVDIEEEIKRQYSYTTEHPTYTPIEVVIQHVLTEKGIKLAEDWKKIVFKDIRHPIRRGQRYRFSLDFEKNPEYTEEEKHRKSSIWLGVNFDSVTPTNSMVVRRCNSSLGFAGSPTMSYDNITEYHYEPCVLDDDFKNINVYYNSSVNINQAEIYATMQYNYFTKNIKVNDRFVVGNVDLEVKENNTVFKVKAVSKFTSDATFSAGSELADEDIPLVLIALDRDDLSPKDDYKHRISSQPSLYKVEDNAIIVPEEKPEETDKNEEEIEVLPSPEPNPPTVDNYTVMVSSNCEGKILLGDTEVFTCSLLKEAQLEDVVFTCVAELKGVANPSNYFELTQIDDVTFTVTNKRTYMNNKLKLVFGCVASNDVEYYKEIELVLGGYY
jgi:hypothetical protein